jgi:hypothetical protein
MHTGDAFIFATRTDTAGGSGDEREWASWQRAGALPPSRRNTMTKLSVLSAAVAAFGLLTIGGANVAVAQKAAQCFTDDGYGRLRSCSQGYKKANPNWRSSDNCYTNDGYGRLRSCSAGSVGFKGKQSKL